MLLEGLPPAPAIRSGGGFSHWCSVVDAAWRHQPCRWSSRPQSGRPTRPELVPVVEQAAQRPYDETQTCPGGRAGRTAAVRRDPDLSRWSSRPHSGRTTRPSDLSDHVDRYLVVGGAGVHSESGYEVLVTVLNLSGLARLSLRRDFVSTAASLLSPDVLNFARPARPPPPPRLSSQLRLQLLSLAFAYDAGFRRSP